jgi:hypothetical protein
MEVSKNEETEDEGKEKMSIEKLILEDILEKGVTTEAEEDGEKQEVGADVGTEHLLGACDVRGVANVDPGGTEAAAKNGNDEELIEPVGNAG